MLPVRSSSTAGPATEDLSVLLDPRSIREVLSAFTELTGLPVTVRDATGHFFGSPTILPRWCAQLRRSDFGFAGCQQAALEARPTEAGRVAEFVCHGSIRHVTAAVVAHGHVVGQIVVGPFSDLPLPDRTVIETADKHGIDAGSLLDDRREIKWLSAPRGRAVGRMIAALANMIGRLAAEALDRQQMSPLTRPRAIRRLASEADRLSPCLLVIEADPVRRAVHARLLEAAGFVVQVASCGQEALAALDVGFPDAVLVCCSPGDAPELGIGPVIRGVADLPIAILSATSDGPTVASALDSFADEYLEYSVSDAELVARLRRIVRRTRAAVPPEPVASTEVDERLTLHLARREAVVDGKTVKLTPTEARLLGSLARRPNRAVPTVALLGEAWPDGDGDQTQLWVHIRSLRRKLEVDPDAPRYLVTLRGQGYMLATAKAAS